MTIESRVFVFGPAASLHVCHIQDENPSFGQYVKIRIGVPYSKPGDDTVPGVQVIVLTHENKVRSLVSYYGFNLSIPRFEDDQDYQDGDEGYREDELWEDPILREADWIEEEDEGIEDEEDMPPKVSEEELEERDQVAAKDELNKLRSMQVASNEETFSPTTGHAAV